MDSGARNPAIEVWKSLMRTMRQIMEPMYFTKLLSLKMLGEIQGEWMLKCKNKDYLYNKHFVQNKKIGSQTNRQNALR